MDGKLIARPQWRPKVMGRNTKELEFLWKTDLPYLYQSQLQKVSLYTYPSNRNRDRSVEGSSPETFERWLKLTLASFPAESIEAQLEERYWLKRLAANYDFRTIPLGQSGEATRVHHGGKEQAEIAHQTLVAYLQSFMSARRLFDDVFEDMIVQRRAFLESVAGR